MNKDETILVGGLTIQVHKEVKDLYEALLEMRYQQEELIKAPVTDAGRLWRTRRHAIQEEVYTTIQELKQKVRDQLKAKENK